MSNSEDISAISRRRFIGQASCAALGSSGLLSSLLTMGAVSRSVAQTTGDYKALVCLFLAGGNDSYNMLTPWDGTATDASSAYGAYLAKRGGLFDGVNGGLGLHRIIAGGPTIPAAYSQARINKIVSAALPTSMNFGLNAAMPKTKALFDANKLAFVSNVGTKVNQNTTGTSNLPVGLFSHSDQIEQWQTCVSDRRTAIGWAGRMVDVLSPGSSSSKAFYNVSLSGVNILQSGKSVTPYSLTADGVVRWPTHESTNTDLYRQIKEGATNDLMNGLYRNIFEKTYANRMRGARDHAEYLLTDDPGTTQEDRIQSISSAGGTIERDLKMVAQMIKKLRNRDGLTRQTYFVRVGGWDHHDEVIGSQYGLLSAVDSALHSFWTQIEADGLQDEVTLFSASDFGRTLNSNGNGSDHGWGGNHFVLGGKVKGGIVYGDYPSMQNLGSLELPRGRLVPTNSVEQYMYPLLDWYGVSLTDINTIFPNFTTNFGLGSNLDFMA